MKSKSEIRERIEEYQNQQEMVAEAGIRDAELRYAVRVTELEWVLENDD